ncbi:augmin complex subunit dgt2 [Drosophila tropicalis]|uniref:augmin complex subunit dgt2 n=1 Tax=Drosophila tropicalis TaxID=46794 RepID=UPI0035ABE0F8
MDSLSATVSSTEIKNLIETRNHELKRVLKLKLLLELVRTLDLGPNPSPEIKRALKLVSIGEYIRPGEGEEVNQENLAGTDLNYADRKALMSKFSAHLRTTLTPIADEGRKLRSEFPDTFINDCELSTGQKEIIRLEKEHRACLEKLVEKLSRKCKLLQTAADLKMGPHLANELKLQQAQAHLMQTKAELLRSFLTNEIATKTEHSVKAHREVEQYLDELLSLKSNRR